MRQRKQLVQRPMCNWGLVSEDWVLHKHGEVGRGQSRELFDIRG